MKTTNHSSVTLLGVKSAFSLFVLFIITVVIHEGAHYVTLLIFSIPIAHFAWFATNYFAPVFRWLGYRSIANINTYFEKKMV